VVLSKTKEFCSVFHGLIRVCYYLTAMQCALHHEPVRAMLSSFYLQQEKQVKKVYLALTTAPVSTGIITHYMRPVNRAPRLVSEGNF